MDSTLQCHNKAFFQRLLERADLTEELDVSVESWHRLSCVGHLAAGLELKDLYPVPRPYHVDALSRVVSSMRKVRLI